MDKSSIKKTMRDAFFEKLHIEMKRNDSIFFLSADFGAPTLDAIRADFPDRFINVGIAEQNLINVATGLALEGYCVYAYAIAPFLTLRAFEQIRANLAILSAVRPVNVNLVGVGAGLSYDVSGPTHHCIEDLSVMRTLPGLEVYSPSDWVQAELLVEHTLANPSPSYLRFDGKPLPSISSTEGLSWNDGLVELRVGGEVCIVATGFMVHRALAAQEFLAGQGIKAGVVDVFKLKPFNDLKLTDILGRYKAIVSVEEGLVERGGLDSAIASALNKSRHLIPMERLGFRDQYTFELGGRDHIHQEFGIDEHGIASTVIQLLEELRNKP